ncbi:serine/threonine-protein kinase [Streptomyces winkii]|uniref:serine/threonine-protein kinase n=1 Tax=Streptomyces winkii TaxID=3051178 RepID=UPI0028D8A2CB|nr:protein kinase [Streptomyces sp. DSM 40971]
MEPLEPGDPRTAGPYRLTCRLGSGGMGRVFLGESPAGRRVAVKVVREDLASSPGFRDRFRREARLAMRAGGFWAAQVVDADPDAAMPWIASQYVDGPSLAQRVARQGPLGEDEVRRLGLGLAEALASFHKNGLVHRDLKPSNVLLVDDGPRVIDFGVSKALETLETSGGADLTRAGTILGTPGFMSPEQALGRPAGPPSDVFSLGALLVHAATGAGAFGDGPSHALLFRVVYEAPDLGAVPYGLRELAESCLRKAPEDRPSAEELVTRLANQQPAAVPDPRVEPDSVPTGRATPGSGAPERIAPETATPGNLAPQSVPTGPWPGVQSDDPHADAVATTGPQHVSSGSPAAATRPPVPGARQVRPAAGKAGKAVEEGAATGAEPAAVPAFAVEEWGPAVLWRRLRRPGRWAAGIVGVVVLMKLTFDVAPMLFVYAVLGMSAYVLYRLKVSLPLLRARELRIGADGLFVRQGPHTLTVPWRDVASVTFTREKNMRELALTVALEKGAGTHVPQPLSPGEGVLRYVIVSSAEEKTRTRAAELESALRTFAGGRYQQTLPTSH